MSGSWLFGFGSVLFGISVLSFWWAGEWSFLCLGPVLSYFVGVARAYGSFDDFGWFLCLFLRMF